MTKIPVQVIGGAYQHPSRPANFQRCVNWFPTISGGGNVLDKGRNVATLMRTMGCKRVGSANFDEVNPTCRGMYQIQLSLGNYLNIGVFGSEVYNIRFDLSAQHAISDKIGNLQTAAGPVIISNNNNNQIMFICYDYFNNVTGGSIYNYETGVFQHITDPNFLSGSHVIMIDGYFIYNEIGTAKFWFSELNDGLSYDALMVATAESKPDKLLALGQTKSELWTLGSNSIEVWYDAGNSPGSPFSKRVGSDVDIGIGAPYSLQSVNGNLLFLDSRGFVVASDLSAFFRNQSSGYNLSKLSTEAIDAEIATYSEKSDCVGSTYNDSGHVMYELTFPSAKKTWVYDTTIAMWHEKSWYRSQTNEHLHSLTNFYIQNEEYTLAGSLLDNNIYMVSRDFLTDNGENIHRIRTTQHIANDFLETEIDCLEVKCDTGKAALATEPGISLRYSNDSGYTWGNSMSRSLGTTGQYGKRVTWNALGSAHEWTFELSVVDPVDVSIVDASIDGTVGDS